MRELSVYYCPKCGYYAYYQLQRNAACPDGHGVMEKLGLPLTKFMDLNCQNRDKLIAWHITQKNPCLKKIGGSWDNFDCIKAMKQIDARIKELEKANSKLKDTEDWMGKMLDELKIVADDES